MTLELRRHLAYASGVGHVRSTLQSFACSPLFEVVFLPSPLPRRRRPMFNWLLGATALLAVVGWRYPPARRQEETRPDHVQRDRQDLSKNSQEGAAATRKYSPRRVAFSTSMATSRVDDEAKTVTLDSTRNGHHPEGQEDHCEKGAPPLPRRARSANYQGQEASD